MTDTLRIQVDGTTHLCRGDTTTTIGSSDEATVHVDSRHLPAARQGEPPG